MDAKLQSKKPTLSLCMIVKDEEAHLSDCLKSVEDVVDEIIVVDIGSTDKTVEIAKQFDAEVHTIQCEDDFAAARNESLKYASGDWILQLDADERLDPESKKELRKWLENKSKMCATVLIDSPKEKNKKGVSRAYRLFRNVPGVRYTGRTHERISPSIASMNGEEGFSNIKVLHLGYDKDEDEVSEKSERGYQLLNKQIVEDPENAYWHYTFAQNLILKKDYDEALVALNRALKLGGLPNDIRCAIYNNLAEVQMRIGRYPEAVQSAEKALSIKRNQTTSHLLLYEIYGYLDQTLKQTSCLEAVRNIIEKRKQSYNDISLEAYVDESALYLNLGNRYVKVKRYGQAQNCFNEALKQDAHNPLAMRGLADCFMQTSEFEKAQKLLEQFRSDAPEDPGVLEKLGWLAIKLHQFDKAIAVYEDLNRHYPQNTGIIKRLAALYSKIGDVEKSRELLLTLKS